MPKTMDPGEDRLQTIRSGARWNLEILKLMHVGCVSDNHVMRVREDGKDCGSGTSIVIRPCFRGYLGEQNTGCGAFSDKNTGPGASQINSTLMWA
jgi:hypothetical protein